MSSETIGLPGSGDRFAGLEVVEEFGHGAWAVVYRARRHGVEYALKMSRAPVAATEGTLGAFRREAAMLVCVAHPGLARIHEVGYAQGRPYLVMDAVEGRNLDSLLAGDRLDEARVVAIARQVAGALAATHRAGLVHQDVKPDNLVVLPDGRVKLIDFGLARWAAGGDADVVAGTVPYFSPEQTGMLKRVVDGRSDLYSLGVVMFRCATGRLPFVSADMAELMRMHTVVAAPDVRVVRPGLSAMFAAIVAKLLAKDPDDRYQSGEGLVADLARLEAASGEPSFPLGMQDVAAGQPEAAMVGRDAELTELVVRWNRAKSGAGGVALVSGAAGCGKSRLVAELVSAARAEGVTVLEGKSAPDDATPMAPLRAAVQLYLSAVQRLPEPARASAVERVRAAAGPVAFLVRTLSPALAELFGDVRELPEDEHRQEQFAAAVSTFLAGLAREAGGAILVLDDVQRLDAATRLVLRQLAQDLPDTPLLVLATGRHDRASRSALAAFTADLEPVIDTRVELSSLDDAAVGQVLAAQLGGAAVSAELTAQLAARSGGNPFALGEYLRAAVDAGLVRPSWGVWVLEEGGLDALGLPADVVQLILARVDGLGGDSRRVLAAAAALGMRFRPDRLAEVCGVDEWQVLEVLRVAVGRRLVGSGDGGVFAFVHDRIREALLADLDEAALRSLHQLIAEVLEASPSPGSEQVYAVARHYLLGDVGRTALRVFNACLTAGQLALDEYAPQVALGFLEGAADAAAAAGIDPDSRFHAALGLAYLRVGRFVEARQRLERALSTEPDRHRRALLHGLTGEAHHSTIQTDETLAAVRRGLAELGRRLPANNFSLVVSTLGLFLAGMLVGWLRWGFGTATGKQRDRYQLESWLNGVAAEAAAVGHRMLLMFCLVLRQLYPANRLGVSPEHIRAYSQLAGALRTAGLFRRSDRLFQRTYQIASQFGDPRAEAYVAWAEGLIRCAMRTDDAEGREILRRVLAEHGLWLDAREHIEAAGALCVCLTFCGYPLEALTWYERGKARAASQEHARHRFSLGGVPIWAMLGRGEEAAAQLRAVHGVLAEQSNNRDTQILYVVAAMAAAVEQNQLGEEFEAAIADLERLRLTPRALWPELRVLWVSLAQGRLAQCLSGPADQRPVRLAVAQVAIRQLRRAASTPFLRAHYLIAQAAYQQLTGEQSEALRRLVRAEQTAQDVDAPILEYEIARVRARALKALGRADEARRQARYALLLAIEYGWEHRAPWIRVEFGIGDQSPALVPASTSEELSRRRLDALQQVSLAAVTVLDPRELARVALDETLRILGAERAFLFLVDDETGRLAPQLGRDATGVDLTMLTGYSTSLVERVHASRRPLVVASDEEGRALGSSSVAAHGLRSIMVAPLQLKGVLRGVVYLDSRVAKGIFTGEDVDLLVAIVNQVAVSLETAHAAQLKVAIQAAQQERDLAETLRSTMAELTQTLDPDEVLNRLLATVMRVVPAEAACLLRRDGQALALAAIAGRAEHTAVGRAIDPDTDHTLTALLAATAPQRGTTATQPPPLPQVLTAAGSWIAVPLAARADTAGLLLTARPSNDAYSDTHVEITAALAGQGMVAYDNARLAAMDGLTGIYNRRHFVELASHRFNAIRGHERTPAAMMLDLDHFKQINDSLGHLIGDEVLREVAGRLRATVPHGDLVGRYGGEEFALLTRPGTNAEQLAEQLRATIAASPMMTTAGPVRITASVGVAHRRPTDRDMDALLARADAALYQAKHQGRDRVISA